MKTFILLSCLLCTFNPLFTEEVYLNNQEVVSHNLKTLIISGDHFYPPEYILKTTEGVLLYRTFAPKSSYEQTSFTKNFEKKYINKIVTRADIENWKDEIAEYFLKSCGKYVFIDLVKGSNDPSTLVLKVVESKIGEILVSGNQWFSAEYYKKNVGLFPEGTIDYDQLTADIDKINRTPWTKAEIVYHKDKGDKVNVELLVKDKKPIQAFSGVNSTLVEELGNTKIFAGATWYFGGLDNSISVEYQASGNLSNYHLLKVEASSPFQKVGMLHFSSETSFMHIDSVLGEGFFVGGNVSLELPLSQTLNRENHLFVGAHYKLLNNNFFIGGTTLASPVSVTEFFATFEGLRKEKEYEVMGSLGLFIQPFAILPNTSSRSYSLLREGASTTFALVKGKGKLSLHFDNFLSTFLIKSAFQWSLEKLLPCEQFSLGGMNTVRGYVQSAVVADSAVLLNIEAQSSKISLLKLASNRFGKKDLLYATFFVDSALGWIKDVESIFMLGVGPGLCYDILDNIHAKMDLGFRLGNLPKQSATNRAMLYFSVGGNY